VVVLQLVFKSRETKRTSLLRLGHAFHEKRSCAHSWSKVYWAVGGITERCLWNGDVGSILRIVKGLDVNGDGRFTWGGSRGHDGCG
jgi:hypothetical protein